MSEFSGISEKDLSPKKDLKKLDLQKKQKETLISPLESITNKVKNGARKVELPKITRNLEIGERFLKFCAEKWEEPERGGELPDSYSSLDNKEFKKAVRIGTLHDFEAFKEDMSNVEPSKMDSLDEKELESIRVREMSSVLEKKRKRKNKWGIGKSEMAIVKKKEDLTNPLGKVGDVTLIFTADLHHAPSDVRTGIREEAFSGYGPQRWIWKKLDKLAQKKRFGNLKENLVSEVKGKEMPAENVVKRYIISEDARHLFNEWLPEAIAKGHFGEKDDETTPIVVSMGDNVTDGAFLIDQLDTSMQFNKMLNKITLKNPEMKPKLIELYGNHDQDSRIPESMSMLTHLFGHRIFTQEVGGALVASVDTNIVDSEWVNQFEKRAGDEEKGILKERKELQEEVLKKIQDHDGPVLLMGHNPAKIIDAFGVKRKIIQNSQVQVIVGGHTHKEDHIIVPFKNKEGEEIVMHVVESTVKVKNGVPQPPKAYSLSIKDGKIGEMYTLSENKERFDKRYGDYVASL